MTAFSAGQLAGAGSMICPEGFLQGWLEYLMAFRTDVFYIPEIIPAYDYSPYGSNDCPDNKWPP